MSNRPAFRYLLAAALAVGACGAVDEGQSPAAPGASTPPLASAGPLSGGRAGDPMFDQRILHDVRLVMDPQDWQALRENFRENQYYAADITIDGERVQQVGIRSRGDGSRDPDKPGLKVDFNKNARTQEFHGYKTLVIDNITQDASMIRERLAFAVYEAMGIPAPQIAHTRLTVNDEYWGVYALIEPVSKPFLKNRLGEESGNLFDYEYAYRWDFSFLGDDPEQYVPSPFEPQTNEDNLDPTDLIDFIRTANEAPVEGFAAAMSKYLDVDAFLTYVAVENALAERDGFVGEFGVNNFYLYQYGRGSTRFVLIPWDKDTAFNHHEWPIAYNLNTNILTDKLTEDPGKMKVYRDAVVRTARTAVNIRFLGPLLDRAYAQIHDAVLEEDKKPYTNAAFEGDVALLRQTIEMREGNILSQME